MIAEQGSDPFRALKREKGQTPVFYHTCLSAEISVSITME